MDSYHLANITDLLATLAWMQSEDGRKKRNKPKPVKRPGEKQAASAKADLIKASIEERKRRRAPRGEVTDGH